VQKIGIDIGGTFTDVVYVDETTTLTLKVPSTPDDPSVAALDALQRLRDAHGVDLSLVDALGHGTTVATNALIQRRGGRTALITTTGFRDVIEIGRLGRPPQAIYDVHYQPPAPLIPRQLRFEVAERVTYQGTVERPLRVACVRTLAEQLRQLQVESVAVCLLYSFLAPAHEHLIQEMLTAALPGIPVLCSCDILPERREYERTSTTAISAYLAPTVTRYLTHMVAELRDIGVQRQMYVMQSNGGLNTPQTAVANPGRLLLSGPAAGVVAAASIGLQAGFPNLISMDMGGTSFDVALVQEGQCVLRVDNRVEGVVCNLPMLNITTIGAGGGSIAWLDTAGRLHVGPHSAGAQPGPACYGQGGRAPTVTDANLVLGWLNADTGAKRLQPHLAAQAIASDIATPLGMTLQQAAAGIYRIVNAAMAGATRLVSVEKGFDPRDFTLLAFGGAGPVHAVAIAEELDIPWVLVPPYPGITSAVGLVLADVVHNFVQTLATELSRLRPRALQDAFAVLLGRAAQTLEADGVPPERRVYDRSLDLKYLGQGYTLSIPLSAPQVDETTLTTLLEHFHAHHDSLYGFRADDEPVELVNIRLRAIGRLSKVAQTPQALGIRDPHAAHCGERQAWAETQQRMQPYQIYERQRLHAGHVLSGPAIVEQADATTVIPPDWFGTVDSLSNLILGTEVWHG
jgi:N-methylhydantoinase A